MYCFNHGTFVLYVLSIFDAAPSIPSMMAYLPPSGSITTLFVIVYVVNHQVGSNVAHWTPNVERNRLEFTRNVLFYRVACDYLSSFLFPKKVMVQKNRLLLLGPLWCGSTPPS